VVKPAAALAHCLTEDCTNPDGLRLDGMVGHRWSNDLSTIMWTAGITTRRHSVRSFSHSTVSPCRSRPRWSLTPWRGQDYRRVSVDLVRMLGQSIGVKKFESMRLQLAPAH